MYRILWTGYRSPQAELPVFFWIPYILLLGGSPSLSLGRLVLMVEQ